MKKSNLAAVLTALAVALGALCGVLPFAVPVHAVDTEDVTYLEPETGLMLPVNATVRVHNLAGPASVTWSAGWQIVRGDVSIGASLTISGNVNIILEDGCFLVADSIVVPDTASLTIWAQSANPDKSAISGTTGVLTTRERGAEAGIGSRNTANGPITICGGDITAKGGTNAAGIGSSEARAGSNITIRGGTVLATGDGRGAGIGGGRNGAADNIKITGGRVTAIGSEQGAGIGSGSNQSASNIIITGGIVTATGDGGGAGIGGGNYGGQGSNITITGGTVTAIATADANGIGSGNGGDPATNIVITGGSVYAQGNNAPDIGAQPTDGTNNVYLRTLTLGGQAENISAKVTAGSVSGVACDAAQDTRGFTAPPTPHAVAPGTGYGICDTFADVDSKVYFWLADTDPLVRNGEILKLATGVATYGERFARTGAGAATLAALNALTVTADPAAGGTAAGGGFYVATEEADVTAVASAGYHFTSWAATGGTFDDATAANAAFTMPLSAATATANFAEDPPPAPSEPPAPPAPAPQPPTGGKIRDDEPTATAAPAATPAPTAAPKPTATNPPRAGNPFTDVKQGDWFCDAVTFAYQNGYMSGTSAITFSPNVSLTRGMMATIVWNMAGKPAATTAAGFDDVAPDKYYAAAIDWGRQKGVISGIGDNLFAPETPMSRQDLVVTLYNYAKAKGLTLPTAQGGHSFTDGGDISPYAAQAVNAFYRAGVVVGYPGGAFKPQAHISRAELAAILRNFAGAVSQAGAAL